MYGMYFFRTCCFFFQSSFSFLIFWTVCVLSVCVHVAVYKSRKDQKMPRMKKIFVQKSKIKKITQQPKRFACMFLINLKWTKKKSQTHIQAMTRLKKIMPTYIEPFLETVVVLFFLILNFFHSISLWMNWKLAV